MMVCFIEVRSKVRQDSDQNMGRLKIEARQRINVPRFGLIDMLQDEFVQLVARGSKNSRVEAANMLKVFRQDRDDRVHLLIDDITLHQPYFIQKRFPRLPGV